MHHFRFRLCLLSAAILGGVLLDSTISRAEEAKPHKLLFFNRSAGFQHSVVQVKDGKPCYAETILRPICEKHHWELVSTKDGTVFTPENIATFDAFLFYTTGDLTDPNDPNHDGGKPMSKEGKQAFLDAIKNGKGYVGFHCASDTFHSEGPRDKTLPVDKQDPYIAMLGGEFIIHGSQQSTTMTNVDPKFCGATSLGPSFKMLEEWYSLKNFADDLHVILVNETKGMRKIKNDKCYDRPPYPATWIHNYGKGRVFYTSMGHREDVWTRPEFQNMIIGGIRWAVGDVEADTSPNISTVTPKANDLPELAEKKR